MIFGHEGLPGSGKSLESMVHLVNALIAGRVVVTNVEGINHAAIADYCALPVSTVGKNLITLEPPKDLDEDQKVDWVKTEFLKYQVKNSLWIFDEINQFFPPDRQKLPADWTKFITEHRHLGMDVLIMGQDLAELHATWRRRLQRYTRLTKLDMMGKEDMYHWASLTNTGRGRFKQTAEGKKPYNKDYFGFYKSHVDGVSNKENYSDKRFNVIQTKHKVIGFFFFLAMLISFYFIWGFFSGSGLVDSSSVNESSSESVDYDVDDVSFTSFDSYIEPEPEPEPELEPNFPIDYLDEKAQQYDLRLTGIIDRLDGEAGQSAFEFVIDFLDPAYRVKERMTRTDVVSLGWLVKREPYGILLTKQDKQIVVRSWPLDNFGKVPSKTIESLKINNL